MRSYRVRAKFARCLIAFPLCLLLLHCAATVLCAFPYRKNRQARWCFVCLKRGGKESRVGKRRPSLFSHLPQSHRCSLPLSFLSFFAKTTRSPTPHISRPSKRRKERGGKVPFPQKKRRKTKTPSDVCNSEGGRKRRDPPFRQRPPLMKDLCVLLPDEEEERGEKGGFWLV